MEDTPMQEPTPSPETDGTEHGAMVEVMHGVILSTVLVVSSYLLGVTYWAVSYGQF